VGSDTLTAAPVANFDPALGRLPTAVAYALFADAHWVSTQNPAIATALEAASENTRIAWASDWSVFRAWALGRASQWFPQESERLRLPVLPEVLVRFITEMVEGECGQGGRSIATVRRYLSTLSTLHRLLDVPDPTKAQIVRNTLKARTRRSGGQTQAAPLRWEQVQQVIEVLPNDLPGLRDKTLLAVAHNSLARRAELVAIDVADVQFIEDGVATVALRPTKTNLEAERDYRFLAAPTTALVKEWLARSGLREGPLFTGIQRSGKARLTNGQRSMARALRDHGKRLTPAHVSQIVKLAIARVAQAQGDLVVDASSPTEKRRALLAYARDYSGHSPRVGAAQDMAAAGVSTAAILQAGGWSDERMVKRYIRRLSALEGGMAQLFSSS
jgi:integrase/recombinase XerD